MPAEDGRGPFDQCHDVIDPGQYFHDCKYDCCANEGPEQLCEDIEAYALACQLQGIPIMNWRESLFEFGCGKCAAILSGGQNLEMVPNL